MDHQVLPPADQYLTVGCDQLLAAILEKLVATSRTIPVRTADGASSIVAHTRASGTL